MNVGQCEENSAATMESGQKKPDLVMDSELDQAVAGSALTLCQVNKFEKPLSVDFIPGKGDVICGRGTKSYNHIGNVQFRRIVASKLDEYMNAKSSKSKKSQILAMVVAEVRQKSPYGGFIKRDCSTGRWFEIGTFMAREKTSQAFRDALHECYRSSNKSKQKRRKLEENHERKAVEDAYFPLIHLQRLARAAVVADQSLRTGVGSVTGSIQLHADNRNSIKK